MTLRVVGAGLGRTGTTSLKVALERLLGGPCYHMFEVFPRPEVIPKWQEAAEGAPFDGTALMADFDACVDWPAAAFWRELAAKNPDAPVVLSTRSSAQAWWESADETIFAVMRRGAPPDEPVLQAQLRMIRSVLENRFTPDWSDAAAAQRAYDEHNAAVRAAIPSARLVEWQPGDGWEPLAAALGVAIPDEPFPHANNKEEFRAMVGLD
jgi:hypothetical protein